jgi:hypothetical protein
MDHEGPEFTFLGLPITAEQEAEIRHYLHTRRRQGFPCNERELKDMLADMLLPPVVDSPATNVIAGSTQVDAERVSGLIDDSLEPIAACEERIAAMEAEAMKHPDH